jgi:hypothetical protein
METLPLDEVLTTHKKGGELYEIPANVQTVSPAEEGEFPIGLVQLWHHSTESLE